jgi:hypothetical protein
MGHRNRHGRGFRPDAAIAFSTEMLKEVEDARIDEVDVQLFMVYVVVRLATAGQSIGAFQGYECFR